MGHFLEKAQDRFLPLLLFDAVSIVTAHREDAGRLSRSVKSLDRKGDFKAGD